MTNKLPAFLKSLEHPELKVIDLSLKRMERYLDAYGNPHRIMPPVIHVAGTNGKGSTIAFLRSLLEAAGKICHVYTSPHLVSVCERFVISGHEVVEAELYAALDNIKQRTKQYPLTYFESLTAAAFELFANAKADYTLLEVGMGGRFDATNVGEPHCCIIMPISFDHQAFLGYSLQEIAFEKAGIIKPEVPVIVAPQDEEAMAVIRKVAADNHAPLIEVCTNHKPLSLPLPGAHQQVNAQTALSAFKQLGFNHEDKILKQGLMQAKWRARLQHLRSGPLIDLLPNKWQLWLDGGHNSAAASMLSQWIKEQVLPVHVVMGMIKDKDQPSFITEIAQYAASLTLIDIPNEPLSMPKELMQHVSHASRLAALANSPMEATQHITAAHNNPGIILICGSLYLAGHILEKNC